MTKRFVRAAVAAVVTVVLTACGGGGGGGEGGGIGGGDPTLADTQGAFVGTVQRSGGIAAPFDLILLDDGTYFGLVGTPGGADIPSNVTSLVYGTNGTVREEGPALVFEASDGVEFQYGAVDPGAGVDPVPVAAPIQHALGATGIAGFADSTAGRLDYSAVSLARYDEAVALPDLVGTFDGTVRRRTGDVLNVTLTIDADGDFSTTLGACTVTGTLVPRAGGKRVFDFDVQYRVAQGCTADESLFGIAFNDATPAELYFVAVKGDGSDAVFAFFNKQ